MNEGPDDSDVVDFLRGFPSMPLIRAVASRYAVEGEIAAALFGALKPMGFYREDVAGFLIDLAENRPLDGEFGNLFFESLASVRTISSGDTMAPVSEAVFSSLVRRDVLSALEVDVILEGIRTLLLVGPGAEIVTGWSGAVGTTTQRTAILSPLIRSFLVEIAERHGHHLIGERADQYREVAGMLYPLSESNRALQALRTSTPLGAVQ